MKRKFNKRAAAPKDTALPSWNLDRLYPGLSSPALAADLQKLKSDSTAFQQEFDGTVEYLGGADLGLAVERYEKICALTHRIQSYAALLESADSANYAATAPLRAQVGAISDMTGFFEQGIMAIKTTDMITRLGAPELSRYAPWIARLRAGGGALHSLEILQASDDYETVSAAAWSRLYSETLTAIKVRTGDSLMTLEQAHTAATDPGKNADRRQDVRAAAAAVLKDNAGRIAIIYNNIIKDRLNEGDINRYSRPDETVNEENGVDPEIVDTMHQSLKAAYTRLSHRYYAWKAQQQGVDVLERHRLEEPLPGKRAPQKHYTFDEARGLVLKALRKFSPKFGRLAERFFDEHYIDAAARPGKAPGGFSLPMGGETLPYILINYSGTADDVMNSLGHELGHGVHQALADRAGGFFLSSIPTVIQETASIFSETLVFDELLKNEKDPLCRRDLIMGRIENMLSSSLQQISFYDFERRVFDARRKGALSAEEISDIWIETRREYYGPSVVTDDYDRYYWMTVPHFFDTPFYVYSYAFAQQVVDGLYESYRDAQKQGPAARDEFVANYITLLETGITRNLHEMLWPFGLDVETPEFWEKGISRLEGFIDALEKGAVPSPGAAAKPPAPRK